MQNTEALESTVFRLTVDSHGQVWRLAGHQLPQKLGYNVPAFLRSFVPSPKEHIRLPGSIVNAELLTELYQLRLRGDFQRLEVCSPLCCELPTQRNDPELMLYAMRRFHRPPSLGGWHEFDLRDYPTYALAVQLRAGTPDSKALCQLVYAHPAWPYVSFVADIDVLALAELLSVIVDPRWYVDTSMDSAGGVRLAQFLGLNGTLPPAGKSARGQRYQALLACWKNRATEVLVPGDPRNFLWRIWANSDGGQAGDLAACRAFLTFLQTTWTMTLCNGPQAKQLFVPMHFFTNPDEVLAYENHLRRYFMPEI